MKPVAALLVLPALLLPACTLSRAEQLARKADKVESKLISERDRVIALAEDNHPEAAARSQHVQTLHFTLRAANIARISVPYAIPEDKRPLAYDVLEETYDTIDWNIPLMPGSPMYRSLPERFEDGRLMLN